MFTNLETWERIIAIIGGVLGILGSFATFLWGSYKWMLKPYIFDPLARNTLMTETVYREMRPNGGTSMKDQINNLVVKGERLTEQCGNIEKRLMLSEINSSKFKGIFSSILSSIHLGHFVVNAKGEIEEVGTMLCRILKRSETELKKNNWQSWVSPDEKDAVTKEWKDAISTGRDFDMTFSCVHPDKKLQKIRMVVFKVQEVDGNGFSGFVGAISAVGKPQEISVHS